MNMILHGPEFLSQFEFSVRTHNVLKNAAIDSLDKFMSLSRRDVMRLKNAGMRTANEIAEMQKYLTPVWDNTRLLEAVQCVNNLLSWIREDPNSGTKVVINNNTGLLEIWDRRDR